jgi:hypothetical protein
MMLSPSAQATPFQGLFLDPAPDQDDLSSALSRFVDRAARKARLSPGARLLSERGLSLRGPITRIEIVLHPGQQTELRGVERPGARVVAEEAPNGSPDDEDELTQDSRPGSDRELDGPESEADPEDYYPADEDRPPVPTQAQIAPLTIESAARLLFALYRPGDRVSLDGLAERMRASGLGVRRQRLVEVLTKLAKWGVLELSSDGSRTLTSSWPNAQEIISRVTTAEEEGDLEAEVAASDWGPDLGDGSGEGITHDA